MMQMVLDGLSSLGSAAVDPLWRPLLAWTVLALPLWALLNWTDRLHPNAEYRLSQILLVALPAGMGAVVIAEMMPGAPHSPMLPARSLVVLPAIEASTGSASSVLWTWMHAVGLLTVGALGVGLFQLGRFVLDVAAVGRARQHLEAAARPSLQSEVDRLRERFGVHRPVQVCTSSDVAVPMTLGGLHPTILVPDRLVDAREKLRMTLRHELVHIRRWDDCAQLVERLVAALFAGHPLVGRLQVRIAEARERACDAAVLNDEKTPAGDYARLLTTFADEGASHRLGALSLSESPSSLIDRLSAMRSSMPSLLSSRFALGTVLVTVGLTLTLGVVACSDGVAPPASTDDSATTESSSASPEDGEVFMVVEDPPELVGGMSALQESISYPEVAKEAGIEGRVIVQFIVDQDGSVTNPKVTRGVQEVLDQAALNAVKAQEFKPGRQDGETVKVQMSLPVTFKLPSQQSSETSGPDASIRIDPPPGAPKIQDASMLHSVGYPDLAVKAGIEGTVHVTLTVDEQGIPQNPRVTQSVHESLDATALEFVQNASFTPVQNGGTPSRTQMTLPIRFDLSNTDE